MIELVGYLGSALVVVSMLMSSVIKLRVINTVGSVIFATYAFIIKSYPTALMNVFLVAINIYNLIKLSRSDKSYSLVSSGSEDSMLDYFLQFYRDDIKKFFPEFSNAEDVNRVYVVFCGGTPVGVLMGCSDDSGRLDIALDYTTPAYRDCSIASYLYPRLPANGIHTLVCGDNVDREHVNYLNRMGFEKKGDVYVKEL